MTLKLDEIRDRLDRYDEWARENHVPIIVPSVSGDCRILLVRVEALEAALYDQKQRWLSIPSGIEEDAREDETSPEDAVAHMGGLAVEAIRKALEGDAP